MVDATGTVDLTSDILDGSADKTISANAGNVEVNREPVAPPASQQPQKVDTQEPAIKPKSLRDQISSALKGEEGTPPAAQQDGKARGPDGKFIAAAADPAAAAAAAAAAPPVDPAAAPAAQPKPVPQGIDATVFNALPAETQDQLARTMEVLNQRHAQFAGYEQLEQLIAPRRQAWALNGMTEAQAVNQLFALSDFASQDPTGFINYFAQQSGIDLEDLVFNSDPGDPEVNTLKQRIAQLEGHLSTQSTQQQQQAHTNTVNEIVQFFSETDAEGKPLRPYADEIGAGITPFVQAALQQNPNAPRAQVLQDAYERACWGTPSIRAKMQQAADTVAEAERLRTAQSQNANARNASSSVAPGVPSAAPQAPNDGSMNLRDTIRASIAAAS